VSPSSIMRGDLISRASVQRAMSFFFRLGIPLPLVWALLPSCLVAQDTTRVTVEGTLVNAITGDPIEGAQLSIAELGVYLVSDSAGYFRLVDLSIGSYRLSITADGFRKAEGPFRVDRAGSFTLRLEPLGPSELREFGQVRGTVRNGVSGEALESAEVTFPGLARTTLSDSKGRFSFRDVPSGTFLMRTESLGYGTRTDSVSVLSEQVVIVEVDLLVEPIELEPLGVVVERRLLNLDVAGFYDRQRGTSGIFLTQD